MRLAVVVQRPHRGLPLCRWAWRLARAYEADLQILWCVKTNEETERYPQGEKRTFDGCPDAAVALFTDLDQQADALGPHGAATPEHAPPLPLPKIEIVLPGGPDRIQAVLQFVHEETPEVLLLSPPETRGSTSLAAAVFDSAPCPAVLLRSATGEAEHCRGVLVATAGGPSARVALRLGQKLARAHGVSMEALLVQTPHENAREVGEKKLEGILGEAGLADKLNVERRVVVGDNLSQAIEETADGHDLVLLGASHVGVLRQLLFGTVPEKVLKRQGGVTVGVVREGWSPSERLRLRLGRWLGLRIPQLDREQRVDLYQRLEAGSAWSFDFMLLMSLSTLIAALGLLQNSAAVVIGAMLVAPLMTPILGVGLALLQGNTHLLRSASVALAAGYLAALALSALCGLVASPPQMSPELLARGGPTLLDMGVALFSGIAAAYCLGRPGLLAALPGVAIAAALVPPIATTGIALTSGHLALAKGSSLLFGTNVVAIILGASVSLFAVGVRAAAQLTPGQRQTRLLFASLLLVLTALAVPLNQAYKEAWRSYRLDADLVERLEAEMLAAGFELITLDCRDRPCRAVVGVTQPMDTEESLKLARHLQQRLPGNPPVRLVTELSVLAP